MLGEARVKSNKLRIVVILSICCASALAAWLGAQLWAQHPLRVFEDCSEGAARMAQSLDERIAQVALFELQVDGRRKQGCGNIF